VELAARQHRLEHVRRVHRSFGGPGADHGVELVDEEDDPARRIGHFLEHRLEPLFELAAVLGAGHQRPHIERDDGLVLESFGHVLADDPLRQPLDHGGLADARLADQHGIVLGAARQYLYHPADLVVASDHRIELALARQVGEVAAVAGERLVGGFRVLAGDPLRAPHRGQRLQHRIAGDFVLVEDPRRGRAAAFGGNRDEEMLGADVFILQPLGLLLRGLGHLAQPGRQGDLRAAVGPRQPAELAADRGRDRSRIRADLLNDRGDDPVALLDQGDEQMLGEHLRVSLAVGELLRAEHRFLCLFGVLVDVHVPVLEFVIRFVPVSAAPRSTGAAPW
jgi:hypothetical protein